MEKVTIVVPIYKQELSSLEIRSFQQLISILGEYRINIIKPVSLDLEDFIKKYSFPTLRMECFEDFYFHTIAGYNKLMLSPEFYSRFSHSSYILIYQLDAYVFKDELADWCDKGYDYIGAPWLEKPVYKLPIIKQFRHYKYYKAQKAGTLSTQSLYNKVGNGGLSLRKVESHYKATIKYRSRIDFYLQQKRSHFFNEDVFWATEVPEFIYPDAMKAIKFSFDKYPGYCYRLNNFQLPFGCHGWYKRKMKRFWKPIIHF